MCIRDRNYIRWGVCCQLHICQHHLIGNLLILNEVVDGMFVSDLFTVSYTHLVIKKRILDKTETAAQSLRLLYDQKATIIDVYKRQQ